MPVKNRPLLFLIILIITGGCNSKEVIRLQIENDSLRNELKSQDITMRSLHDISIWLDSIDTSRNFLLTNLEGNGSDEFSSRLIDINEFVKISEEKIRVIQNALKSSNLESSAYSMLVDALKSEVQLRVDELIKLNEQLTIYKCENEGLQETIKVKENEANDISQQALNKEQELFLLEAKIQAMVNNFKVAEADAYYARARAVEETARRTRLVPHKKRATYQEALELYKKSLSLGKNEAKSDIVRLENR